MYIERVELFCDSLGLLDRSGNI